MSVNIRNTEDPFARYKMSKLMISKVKTNTKFDNLLNISSELHVPKEWIAKYIASELGTGLILINDNGAVFRGKFSQKNIEHALRNFIDTFVLCNNCNLPELDYEIGTKKRGIKNCRACGANQRFKTL
jgi:translation initiation factor 2 subunit 2